MTLTRRKFLAASAAPYQRLRGRSHPDSALSPQLLSRPGDSWAQAAAKPVLPLKGCNAPGISESIRPFKKGREHLGWAVHRLPRVVCQALYAMLVFVALPLWAANTNPPTASAPGRDQFVAEIKSYAQRHVKTGAPLQTKLILDIFSQTSPGLSQGEIATLYEEEYASAQSSQKQNTWTKLQDQFWSGSGWTINVILLLEAIRKGRWLRQGAHLTFLEGRVSFGA